ncbi:hypothetical protein G9A89_013845 [Geosiphon pyriformis]|nr:hypothetical protein G9A89_013845 [Geosiphon pyriformis]
MSNGNTTESDSVDIEEKFLVEETSFNYGKSDILAALGKPLEKIDFLGNDDNDILLDKSVKSAQEKLMVIRKLFSKINGFGGASTLSKFAGIIRVIFIFELSLVQASKKAGEVKISVNTDLKKSSEHSDQTVIIKKIPIETLAEAVYTALFEFGTVVLIKIQLVSLWQKAVVKFDKVEQTDLVTACWFILIGKNAVYVRCAVVCFETAKFLDVIMGTTSVLRGVNLHWSHLGFSKYAKYEKVGHILLNCSVGENLFFGRSSYRTLLNLDKSRLAIIYVKHSAPVACPVAFGKVSWAKIAGESLFSSLSMHSSLINSGFSLEMKPTLSVIVDIEKRFTILESSLTSLTGQFSELAKRLDSFMSADQMGNIVMGKNLGGTTGGKTAVKLVSFVFFKVKRLEIILERLSALVLSLTARFDGLILAGGTFPNPSFQ